MRVNNIKEELKFIKKISWEEVFDTWQENEKVDKNWEKHYQGRGFSSWKEWRKTYVDLFNCSGLNWKIYRIKNPTEIVSGFYGGRFKTWVERYYQSSISKTFGELVKQEAINSNKKIIDLAENLRQNQTVEGLLIGIIVEGKIVIIEGMHRCSALALLKEKGEDFKGSIQIALAESKIKFNKIPTFNRYKKIKGKLVDQL